MLGGTDARLGARRAGSSSRASRRRSAPCCSLQLASALLRRWSACIVLHAPLVGCRRRRSSLGFALPFVCPEASSGRAGMRAFEEQFPEALDLLARALQAGHAFPTGLRWSPTSCTSRSAPSSGRRSTSRTSACRCKDALDEPGRSRPAARRAVLRDRRAHPARDRRQPVGDSRQPRARRARAVQDPAPGARPHGARPLHRLRAAGAAGGPRASRCRSSTPST